MTFFDKAEAIITSAFYLVLLHVLNIPSEAVAQYGKTDPLSSPKLPPPPLSPS